MKMKLLRIARIYLICEKARAVGWFNCLMINASSRKPTSSLILLIIMYMIIVEIYIYAYNCYYILHLIHCEK